MKLRMVGAALALGFAANNAPNASTETTNKSRIITQAEQDIGAIALPENITLEPTTTTIPESFIPQQNTTLQEDTTDNRPARLAATKLIPVLEAQTPEVDINYGDSFGVSLLITIKEKCTAKFDFSNDFHDKPLRTDIRLMLFGPSHILKKALDEPNSPEANKLYGDDTIGHGDNLFPDSIVLDGAIAQSEDIVATEMIRMTGKVCAKPIT